MKQKFLYITFLLLSGLVLGQWQHYRQERIFINQRFLEEIAEQQAYHAIAAAYFRQLHPSYSWDDCLIKTKEIMLPTKKWILKELKNQ